nr:LPXTG cell wall anchor domain-containing protein [uncultured Blautia sp.]
MKKNNKPAAKRYMKTVGMVMASVMVLSSTTGQMVYAETAKDQKDTQDGEKKEEKITVYLNGQTGNDKKSGESPEEAVKSFKKAAELAGESGVIRICGTVTVEDEETWELPSGVSIRRAKDFEEALVQVDGSLKLDNVRMYTEDITGDGKVEGAVEKENVYVPKVITVKDPKALSEISLEGCDGDGVFSWKDEDTVPSEYETDYQVVFHPYDTKKIDYSKEKGWDAESETVTRQITVRVKSLKPEVTPTPEVTDTPEATPTPEAAPEVTVTPEPTTAPEAPEQTETTPEPTPEVTEPADSDTGVTAPTATPEPTAEPSTEPEVPAEDHTAAPTPETPEEPGTETPDTDSTQKPSGLTWEQMNEIAAVQEQLDFLPSEVTTPEEVEAIVAATKEYEALSEAQKAYIESDSLVLLQTAQEGAKTVNRTSNGVTVAGDFPWYIQFQVQLNNDKSDSSVLAGQNADTFISPYEMQLWDLMNECEYQLNGQQVRITMPAPDDQLYTQLVVIHYLKDGSVEYITPIYNADGTLSFVTTSFSPYDVAGLKLAGSQSLVGNTDKAYGNKNTTSSSGTTTKLTPNVSAGSTSGSVTKKNTQKSQTTQSQTGKKSSGTTLRRVNPKTGDMQQTAWYAGFAAAALAVLGIAGKKTRKKEI